MPGSPKTPWEHVGNEQCSPCVQISSWIQVKIAESVQNAGLVPSLFSRRKFNFWGREQKKVPESVSNVFPSAFLQFLVISSRFWGPSKSVSKN